MAFSIELLLLSPKYPACNGINPSDGYWPNTPFLNPNNSNTQVSGIS
jgi:hypothetical protein